MFGDGFVGPAPVDEGPDDGDVGDAEGEAERQEAAEEPAVEARRDLRDVHVT
jgi:hypothetical protein